MQIRRQPPSSLQTSPYASWWQANVTTEEERKAFCYLWILHEGQIYIFFKMEKKWQNLFTPKSVKNELLWRKFLTLIILANAFLFSFKDCSASLSFIPPWFLNYCFRSIAFFLVILRQENSTNWTEGLTNTTFLSPTSGSIIYELLKLFPCRSCASVFC